MTRRAAGPAPALPGLNTGRLLGSGGFSDVYLYEQELPRRRVAVKILAADDISPSSRQGFIDEANRMAQLSAHPYIVTIHHADVAADGRPYIVMEYCSGPSLADQARKRPFSVENALRTGIRVAGAVATAHAAGILHRDIKPANVLTNDYGWPALTDFGISSAVDTSGEATRTAGPDEEPELVGMSIPWSPPEMFADDPRPDVRSDIFSLAATIYTLVAGRTPFEDPRGPNGAVDLIGRIERGQISPLGRSDVPASMSTVLARGLARRPEDRFSSVVAFARALQRVELELGYAATPIDVPNLSEPEREPERDGGDDEDATRIRAVPTVHAQRPAARPGERIAAAPPGEAPVPAPEAETPRPAGVSAPPAARTATALPAAPALPEATVRRMRPVAPSETASPERSDLPAFSSPAPAEDAPPPAGTPARSPRYRLRWLLGAAGVLVVGAAITVGILAAPPPGDAAAPGSSGEPVVTTDPVPLVGAGDVEVGGEGTEVTFTWTNPAPESGDRYLVQPRIGTEVQPKRITEDARVTLEVPARDTAACVDVQINRAGRLSPEPTEICR